MAYFDGDPFPADDQMADGEATLHDRALGMLRVLIVNIDRLHRDPAERPARGRRDASPARRPTRGTTIDTASVAYSIVTLRTLRRALTSELQLYSNTTPDTTVADLMTVLDGAEHPAHRARPAGPR